MAKPTKLTGILYRFFPLLGVLIALAVQLLVPDSDLHPEAVRSYYTDLLLVLLSVAGLLGVLSLPLRPLGDRMVSKGPRSSWSSMPCWASASGIPSGS